MGHSDQSAFDNVRCQVGACGLWCGSCAVGNGTLAKLARKSSDLVRAYGLGEWAEEFDYPAFLQGLTAIGRVSHCPGCLRGGGRDNCEIRRCASGRGLTDCTQCGDRSQCQNERLLEHMRTGARKAGMLVLESESDRGKIPEEWTAVLASRWPTCVMFVEDPVQPETKE